MTGLVIRVSQAKRLSRMTLLRAKLVNVPGRPTAPFMVLPTKLIAVPGKSVTKPTPPLATNLPTPKVPLAVATVPLTPNLAPASVPFTPSFAPAHAKWKK